VAKTLPEPLCNRGAVQPNYRHVESNGQHATARKLHTAKLLTNGEVLVVGGLRETLRHC
jgi:hypothetical protein